jgi:alkanesulfonate monooxygenase SsuD/methylene tetrahydromethanopterin reductase-like flavin-dependent oxidoreductase (luciferase family)
VLIATYRDPILVAKQVGTLAALAGPDRVILGVGAGWMYEEFASLGIPFGERFDRLDEHVAAVRSAWSGQPSAFEGRFYRHPPAGFLPVPPGGVPIIIGGGGDGALRRVARYGDGWAMPGPTPGPDAGADLAGALDRLRRACEREGRDVDDVLLVAGAPISAGEEFFDLLAGAGVDLCDVMLDEPADLDLRGAEAFVQAMAPRYRDG